MDQAKSRERNPLKLAIMSLRGFGNRKLTLVVAFWTYTFLMASVPTLTLGSRF